MKVELIYNLKEGVRAADVDLNPAAGKFPRQKHCNPDSATVLQLYNNWFNVKVVLVEADGTRVVKDYSSPDFLNYFTTKHNCRGTPKTEGSSFIFQYSRKFGEMHIKVVDTSPDERPVLIVRGHKLTGKTSVPRVFDVDLHKNTKLPFVNDRVDDFFENAAATYGTTVHFLDLNQEAVPGQTLWLEQENLKALEMKLAAVMSYKKHAYSVRVDSYANTFHTESACLEAEALNKHDCETTVSEIADQKHYPERVNSFVMTAMLGRLNDLIKKEVDGKPISNLGRTSAVAAIHLKVQQNEQSALEAPQEQAAEPAVPIVTVDTEMTVGQAISLVSSEPDLPPSPEPFLEIVNDESLDNTIALLASSAASELPELLGLSDEDFNPENLLSSSEEESSLDNLDDLLGPSADESNPQDLFRSLDVEFNPDDLIDDGLGGWGSPSEPKRARVMGEY